MRSPAGRGAVGYSENRGAHAQSDISSARIDNPGGPGFASVTPATTRLNPGDQADVEVRFTAMPVSTGLFDATVRIALLDVETFEIPLTASGKILKRELVEMARRGELEPVPVRYEPREHA